MPGQENDSVKSADRMKLTYDHFLLFPDDGKRHELIDGEHYVTPSSNTKHQRAWSGSDLTQRAHIPDRKSTGS